MFVYILTNERRTTLYIGVTNDLAKRVWHHGEMQGTSFTHRYNLTVLIYFEEFSDPAQAIAREKQLKGWTRAKKEALIATMNPEWRDLIWEFTGHAPAAESRDPSTPRRATFARRRSAQDDFGWGCEK
jgi:putative endonuclease